MKLILILYKFRLIFSFFSWGVRNLKSHQQNSSGTRKQTRSLPTHKTIVLILCKSKRYLSSPRRDHLRGPRSVPGAPSRCVKLLGREYNTCLNLMSRLRMMVSSCPNSSLLLYTISKLFKGNARTATAFSAEGNNF